MKFLKNLFKKEKKEYVVREPEPLTKRQKRRQKRNIY